MKASTTERAYLAGILDADGWITIKESTSTRGQRFQCMVVGLKQVRREAIDLLVARYGGTVCQRKATGNCRAQWYVELRSDKGRVLLVEILPFLRIKTAQALIAVEYQDTVQGLPRLMRPGRGGRAPLPEAVWDQRAVLRDRILALNSGSLGVRNETA